MQVNGLMVKSMAKVTTFMVPEVNILEVGNATRKKVWELNTTQIIADMKVCGKKDSSMAMEQCSTQMERFTKANGETIIYMEMVLKDIKMVIFSRVNILMELEKTLEPILGYQVKNTMDNG